MGAVLNAAFVTNSTNVLEMISPRSFPTGAWSMLSLSYLPIGYENPRTNGGYFDIIRLILSKHLKHDASTLPGCCNGTGMLQKVTEIVTVPAPHLASLELVLVLALLKFRLKTITTTVYGYSTSLKLRSNCECVEAKFSQIIH